MVTLPDFERTINPYVSFPEVAIMFDKALTIHGESWSWSCSEVSKEDFGKLPAWKRAQKKRELKLF